MKLTRNEYIQDYLRKINKQNKHDKRASAIEICERTGAAFITSYLCVHFNKDKHPVTYWKWDNKSNKHKMHIFKGSDLVARQCALYHWKEESGGITEMDEESTDDESEEVKYAQASPSFKEKVLENLTDAQESEETESDDETEESDEHCDHSQCKDSGECLLLMQ